MLNFQGSGLDWPILQRWDTPWDRHTVKQTLLAWFLSSYCAGVVIAVILPYLGFQKGELSLDQKARKRFFDHAFASIVELATLFTFTSTNDKYLFEIYNYDWRDPFSLEKGWLLWGGIGVIGSWITTSLAAVAMSSPNHKPHFRENRNVVLLLSMIGSSGASTTYLIGTTGVIAPFLEETVFRGFLMVALTKWLPTPISVLITAAAFSAVHTHGKFTRHFINGTIFGLSYAHTRNLLTPITIHALWNMGVLFRLTFLKIQGYDLKELLRVYSGI